MTRMIFNYHILDELQKNMIQDSKSINQNLADILQIN